MREIVKVYSEYIQRHSIVQSIIVGVNQRQINGMNAHNGIPRVGQMHKLTVCATVL